VEIIIDLSNYKDTSSARVPEGRYRVVVDDVETDTAAKTGNTVIKVWLRILGGTQDGEVIIDRLTITPKAMFRVVGFMQGIGIPTPKKRLAIDLRSFLHRQVDVDVEDDEPYNGRIKSRIARYIRIAQPKAEEAAEDDLEAAAEKPAKPSSDAKKAEAAAIVQDADTEDMEPAAESAAGTPGEYDSEDVDIDNLSIEDLDL
jgi:hypothetical protein